MMTQLAVSLIGFALSLAAAGCNKSNAATGEVTASMVSASLAASDNLAAAKVAKVVFVGKERACDCTRKAVDAGWTALQKALGTPAKVPVERLQIDTEGPRVELYRKQKPMMALPAIYFVDGKGVVVELLQGEVTADQIAKALGPVAAR